MKVIIKVLLVIVCVLSFVEVSAQVGVRRKSFHEFRMGGNSSEMDMGSKNYDKKAKIGFHFAYMFSYKFLDPIDVQTGIMLTKKGVKQRINSRTEAEIGTEVKVTNTRFELDANYVQIPLMIGWESPYDRLWKFNVHVGGYGAWGFKGKTKRKGSIEESIGTNNEPVVTNVNEEWDTFSNSVLKKLDYGLVGSVGFAYDIYLFNVSYEYGLANVSKAGDDFKNRNLTVAVGLRF